MYKLKKPRPEIIVSIKTEEDDFWWKIKTVPIKRTTDTKKISGELIDYAKELLKTCQEGTLVMVHFNKTLFTETKK